MKNPGRLIQCGRGKGIIRNKSSIIEGKFQVELVDDNFKPILENGKPKVILVWPANCTLIGYVD